ncbi:cell death-inducing p53-target protein 1-like [Dermacentor albipictus]|uniref:cell death-inducing p53-target protein 1-like n=1 Tax=Dermacentor albipictus TaxID=60249 RepID=UPI0038FC4711
MPQREVSEGVNLTARPSMTPEKWPAFGDVPVQLTCPQCHRRVTTRLELKIGCFAMSMACVTCFVFCPCCFWVPLYMDYFKDVCHVCPHCNAMLYERKRC